MKKLKFINLLLVIVTICSIFIPLESIKAASSATVGFSGNSTVAVGDNITVKMYISNVVDTNGGVVSLSGNLSFDSNYLDYVSGTGVTSPYAFQINPSANYIIAGLDTTLSFGITGSSQTTVFTFVFKAKKEGTTQVTLNNAKLSDVSSKITANISAKTITIGENKSSDATLKALGVTGYTLSPTFTSSTTSYKVKVPSTATSVTITGTANDSKATVTGLGNITLSGDSTTAHIKVKAEDGSTKTYTVSIEKEVTPTDTKSSDATLKSLGVSGYTLSPSFSSNTTSYTVKVPSSASTLTITGSVNDSKAIVTGLGNVTLSGSTTTTEIKVKAEDGTIKTYTIKIEKEAESTNTKSSDATLKSLDVSGFTLTPTFKSNINTYSMKVKNNITALNVKALPNHDKASVTITGNKNWQVGVNAITIKVKAEDGTINTYIVNVTREGDETENKQPETVVKSSDNYLKNLTITSSHEIKPSFDKNISNYSITVPYEVDKLDLSYIKNDPKSSVEIKGNSNFLVDKVNVVEVIVTSEDGTKRIYTLNVTRNTDRSDNDLKNIIIDGTNLSPSFDPDILEYTTTVDGDTDTLNITATPENSDSKVEIIGNKNLKEGKNTVLIKVTDKNGYSKYYTIDVDKKVKEDNTIFGLKPIQFWLLVFGISFLLLILLLLLLLLLRRKDKKQEVPNIEIKPEFNFGSKNTSDDDVVHGNLNQDSQVSNKESGPSSSVDTATLEAVYEELEDKLPYDPYDEVVTKRELVDAINDAVKTKDPTKLKMLLEQEALNQKKKELRDIEENSDTDDRW